MQRLDYYEFLGYLAPAEAIPVPFPSFTISEHSDNSPKKQPENLLTERQKTGNVRINTRDWIS